jgi:hypothetical protein
MTLRKSKATAEAISRHLRALGCTCEEVDVIEQPAVGGVQHVSIQHDDDCPVMMKINRRGN